MTEQEIQGNVNSDVTVEGRYRLVDATPEPDWSKEEQVRWYKKNVAAALILAGSLFFLAFLNNNNDLKILSLTLAGGASSVLLNGEAKQGKK